MRPYLAVIADSFREALHSRVLWLLLGLITLLLLLLLPLGMTFPLTTKLRRNDIRSAPDFARRLVAAGREETAAPRRVVWDQLSTDLQRKIREMTTAEGSDRRREFELTRELVSELNELLPRRDLFTDDQLERVALNEEAERLRQSGLDSLSPVELQRLNRLALEAIFSREIESGPGKSVQVRYLGLPVADPIPISQDDLHDVIKMSLAIFMDVIAAPLGVFVAILVTASIIPNMFDSGSVSLLFSKPIVRSLLYLAKFLGGCWFVLINASYLIGGLWLVVGLRFGVWHAKLLWVIPILTFLFAVYYTVSALAGVIWRNTIMAVVAAILFWAACFTVGTVHDLLERILIQPQRLVRIVPAGDQVLTVTESGVVQTWPDAKRTWQPVFASKGGAAAPAIALQNRLLGPLYDPSRDRILAIDRRWSQSQLLAGYRQRDWNRELIDAAPSGCIGLMRDPQGEFVVLDRAGITRVEEVDTSQNKELDLFGWKYTIGPRRSSFRPAGPKSYVPAANATAVAMNPDDGSLLVYGQGQLQRLLPEGEERRYAVVHESELLAERQEAIIASAGDYVVLAADDGEINLLQLSTLEQLNAFRPHQKMEPRFALAGADGRFLAVVFHNRRIWLYDTSTQRDISSRLPRQGQLTTAEFVGPDVLLVADQAGRVRRCSLPTGKVEQSYMPKLSILETVHYYLVIPIYRLFPKPGKLKETSSYLLMEKQSLAASENESLEGARVELDPWSPVWNSAIFIAVMLAVACLFIQWQEF